MTRQRVTVGNALDLPGYPVCAAVASAGLVHTSGIIAISPDTGEILDADVSAQTHQVLDNLECVLAAAGCTLDDLLFVDVLLRDVERDFAAFNEVYAARVAQPPARRTYGVVLALPQLLIEISAVASRPVVAS